MILNLENSIKKIFYYGTVAFLILQGCSKLPENTINNYYTVANAKPYKVMGKWYNPIWKVNNFKQKGIASWYGEKFHGQKTASGEIYDMYAMTAAHKTLPLNCRVRILNLSNGKWVDVKINDRGPFVKNRIVDLSYAAAKKIGIVKDGTASVKISYLEKAIHTKSKIMHMKGPLEIQVGAFVNKENAESIKTLLSSFDNLYTTKIVPFELNGKVIHRIRIGTFLTMKEVYSCKKKLKNNGFIDILIIYNESL